MQNIRQEWDDEAKLGIASSYCKSMHCAVSRVKVTRYHGHRFEMRTNTTIDSVRENAKQKKTVIAQRANTYQRVNSSLPNSVKIHLSKLTTE